MAVATGTRLGPYEITAALGAGGMGEVYSARDTRLDRSVAIKILPVHLSDQPEARERFEREARAISSLNHPNICQLYDVGQQDGIRYLVMEHLQGETLASRLAKGGLPVEPALRYAIDICEGLDKAHHGGVVHRDLKPANIMLTKSGAKLMDFGLAKAAPPLGVPGKTVSLASPSHPLTAEGTVIGTFQYMAPEQLEGKEADARSDLFSFGAVLYEMVTGRRAFEGKSQISVASAILEKEPEPISTLQPLAPPALEHVARGCLAKDPEARWQSAGDVARELRWILSAGSQAGVATPLRRGRRNRERLVWGALVGLLALAVIILSLPGRHTAPVIRASMLAPADAPFNFIGDVSGPPVLSPDGTRVAFTAGKQNAIWVRALERGEAQKLEGTEGASFPFWSPDGRFIGFIADRKMKKISANGGPAAVITEVLNARGASWSAANTIVYTPDYRESIWKVSAKGGTPVRVTTLDSAQHTTQRWPWFLPDGKHFLYFATNHAGVVQEHSGIYFASLDGGPSKFVVSTDSGAQYASGYLLFHNRTALMAQNFDPSNGTLSGEPTVLVDNIQYDNGTWHTAFTASDNGVLLYEPSAASAGLDLLWFDRSGKQLGAAVERGAYRGMRISPDGKRLAISVGDPTPDIWVVDLARGSRTRVTFDPASHFMPAWSPDGQRLVFMTQTGGAISMGSSLHAKPANGSGQDELLVKPDKAGESLNWPQFSPDGKYLVYELASGPTGATIWSMALDGERKRTLLIQPQSPQARVVYFRLSNDGQWLAYSSTDSGREEVYVTSFPGGAGRWQVSANGGTFPVWRSDSKELYYMSNDWTLMAAQVHGQGTEFEVENTRSLFRLRDTVPAGSTLDVSPDGQRFVIASPPNSESAPLTLVLNWTAELSR